MEYTVQKLGRMAGISARTLRYYDEIGILKPARINSSGYRIYGKMEIEKLQQILFYKELGVDLDNIKRIVSAPAFNEVSALKDHREKLLDKKKQIELLIANVEKTIASKEGSATMTDNEMFEGFKQNMIDENEEKYGEEIREKYGEDQVKKSYQKVKNMTKEQHDELQKLADDIKKTLNEAYKTGDPAGELAQKAADMHRRWLTFYWDSYSKEAHAAISQMYVDDERFTKYYDTEQPGTAAFFRDAIYIFTGMNK